MFAPKFLTYELNTEALSVNDVATLYYNMFTRKDYDWWYEILPDDVVVDIGANIGAFTAKALDAGASKVYMIEPNRKILKCAIGNVSDAFMNTTDPKVIPINAAVGRTDIDLNNIFKSSKIENYDEDPKLMSLMEFVETYKIDHIDYLKIDACGAEYNILHEDNIDFLSNKVRHIAVRCHLNAQYGSTEKFVQWRDRVLRRFVQEGKVRFQDNTLEQKLFQDDWREAVRSEFMVYITNY